jgi:chromosome partitioning protein
VSRIIALSNQKGGVAKTTSCISIGACLAETGQRTLIVDLDPQAHLTIASGLNPDELSVTIVDLLAVADEPVDEVIQSTSVSNLDILPADLRLAETEMSFYNHPDYEEKLVNILGQLRSQYRYILLDCPPSLGGMAILALTAAEYALIPVPCEYFASRGLIRMMDIVEAVRKRTNPGLEYGLFVSLYDARNRVSRQILEQLRQHFGGHLFDTVVNVDTRLRESTMVGEPITTYAPQTRSSQQYRALAQELVSRLEDENSHE